MDYAVSLALLLSFLAGISTTIGAAIAFFVKKPTHGILGLTLGFSAGVMINVSFVELLTKSMDGIGFLHANFAFFVGIAVILAIDILIPHEYIAEKVESKDPKLMKTGILTAIGTAIHNFPEGFTTFVGSLYSIEVGILLAIAIAIHNIPEGISVYIPIFHATGNKKKAFLYSFASGIFEPIGAVVGAAFLIPFMTDYLIFYVLAFVAGIMIYISFDELLPAAHKYGKEHTVAVGVISGMAVMMLSSIIFR
ncbi:MAG: zinc transporter ZupT [Candidatus Bathyarchaeota archaeon]|nr:MAG: zinc transporter ZupT [Candidatus Bathyarchaeota archaeon]